MGRILPSIPYSLHIFAIPSLQRTRLIWIFLLSALSLQAQQYNFKNYSVREGVAQSQVYSLLQDSRGYLWMGTRGGGITRFDGIAFKTYSQKDGLANNYVFCIREDTDHNLWVGTNNGVSRYNGITFKNYRTGGDTNQLWVLDMAFDRQGRKWLATNYGVMLLENDSFTNITILLKDKISLINTIYTDDAGNVWYGNAMGLSRIYNTSGTWQQDKLYRRPEGLRSSVNAIEPGNKELLIGTYNDGLYAFRHDSFLRIAANPELDKQSVFDIYTDRTGNIWMATLNKGVCQYSPSTGSFSWLGENEGLSNNHVRSIIQDRSGNYWFGTSGGGACNYFGKQFTTYDKSSGLAGNFIYSIYGDSKKRLLIGTSDKGLTILDSGRFKVRNASNGFMDVKIKAICEDNKGHIYLGTEANGVFLLGDSTFTVFPQLTKKYVRAMAKDLEGNIWVATSGAGLYMISRSATDSSVKHWGMQDGLLSNRISSLHADKRGIIWYGTENNGIGTIGKNGIESLTLNTKNGLPANSIRCFVEDGKGHLWIGTGGNGIVRYSIYKKDLDMQVYDYAQGLTSSNIYLLSVDAQGNIFAGSETGLDHLIFSADGKLDNIKHFSKGEGFTGIETCQNAVYNDGNGVIWFGTINGLSRYVPADKFRNENAPVTRISGIRLFYEPISATRYKTAVGDWNAVQALVLPYSQNHLTFDFEGINLSNPDAVKYKWKLEGFDHDWSPASTQRTVTYSNLPYGDFTFQVMACNEDGIWNKVPSSFHFTIMPPFWMRWWVITLAAVLVLGILFLSFRWRIQRIRRKAREEQQKITLEKEIIELEQKALRLQMNPHFIFNALNSIQSQIGTDNEQAARYYLAKFSRLMRQILDNSRNSVITLQEEINTLENYLLIEKFCNGDRFDYKFIIDPHIETDYITTPPMLLQPFIENAIKHGLRYMDGRRGLITVEIHEKDGILECSVTDNGIGRAKSEEMNKLGKETYHKSTALLVTRERLDLVKADKDIKTLEIIDLYDEHGNATGTRVIIRIPIT